MSNWDISCNKIIEKNRCLLYNDSVMKKKTLYIILSVIIVAGLVVDLITKSVFARILEFGDNVIVVIPNLLRFVYVENDGAAYGMLGGKTWFLIVITIVFLIAFVCYYVFSKDKNLLFTISIGLIVSGAIGNLVDRIFFDGIVRDFISIEFFSFVFNIADMWITFGVICFALHVIIDSIKDVKEKKENNINDTKDKWWWCRA